MLAFGAARTLGAFDLVIETLSRGGDLDLGPCLVSLNHPDRFDAESAEANYREALGLAEPRGMRPLVAHCHLGLGKLYRRTGKREQARERLTTATTMYREMGMTYWLEQTEAELKESQHGS